MTVAKVDPKEQVFSARVFRDAVGVFATGITVITTSGVEGHYGMTASSFTSVSLDPPLVLVCVISGTLGAETISQNGVFAVNILSADQEALSGYFASRDRPRGPEAFDGIQHHESVSGSPILDGIAGHLDCRVVQCHEAGDHLVFIGEVLAVDFEPEASPLLFHRGCYRLLHESD